jgi:hypothetical protein
MFAVNHLPPRPCRGRDKTGQTIGHLVRFGARWQSGEGKIKRARSALLTTVLWHIAHDREKKYSSTDDFISRRLHHIDHCAFLLR